MYNSLMAQQNPTDCGKHHTFFSPKNLLHFFTFFAVMLLGLFLTNSFVKPASAAGITFVQASAAAPGTKATAEKITFSKTIQQGDLLIGWFAQKNASGQISVSDNVNGAWT